MKSGLKLLTAAVLLTACGDIAYVGGKYDSLDLSTPVAVGAGFVQIDEAGGRVWLFSPQADALDVATLETEGEIHRTVVGEDGHLYVLTRQPAAVVVVDPLAPGDAETYPLNAGFTDLAVSPDGRFAVAHFTPGAQSTDDAVLFSPNQIAIVDREAPAESAVRPLTLADAAPIRFTYAPPFTLADPATPHRYAVAVGAGALSFVNLEATDPAQQQRIVPLAEPGTGQGLVARDLLFSTDDPADPNDMTVFVLAAGSPEIFAIDLLPADPATGRVLQPAINQVGGGGSPSTMFAFNVDGRDKLLVTEASATTVMVIDVETSRSERVNVGRVVSRAVLWEAVEDGDVRPRALFYQPGTDVVYFAELDALEQQGQGAVRALALDGRVQSVQSVGSAGSPKAVAFYSDRAGFEVIDLAQRRSVAIPARLSLANFVVDGDWFFTVSRENDRLVAVDLRTSTPVEVEIPAAGESVSIADGTLLVEHREDAGWLTAYRVSAFTEGPFAEAYAYALTGLFDRED